MQIDGRQAGMASGQFACIGIGRSTHLEQGDEHVLGGALVHDHVEPLRPGLARRRIGGGGAPALDGPRGRRRRRRMRGVARQLWPNPQAAQRGRAQVAQAPQATQSHLSGFIFISKYFILMDSPLAFANLYKLFFGGLRSRHQDAQLMVMIPRIDVRSLIQTHWNPLQGLGLL